MAIQKRIATAQGKNQLMTMVNGLVPRLYEAEVAFGRALNIESLPISEVLGPPSTRAEINKLQAFYNQKLPPSYQAFLRLYGRWEGIGGTDLLSPAEQMSEHAQSNRASRSALFFDNDRNDPFAMGAIPIGLSDARTMILLEQPIRDSGEMDVVVYDIIEESERYPDLLSFFEGRLRKMVMHSK